MVGPPGGRRGEEDRSSEGRGDGVLVESRLQDPDEIPSVHLGPNDTPKSLNRDGSSHLGETGRDSTFVSCVSQYDGSSLSALPSIRSRDSDTPGSPLWTGPHLQSLPKDLLYDRLKTLPVSSFFSHPSVKGVVFPVLVRPFPLSVVLPTGPTGDGYGSSVLVRGRSPVSLPLICRTSTGMYDGVWGRGSEGNLGRLYGKEHRRGGASWRRGLAAPQTRRPALDNNRGQSRRPDTCKEALLRLEEPLQISLGLAGTETRRRKRRFWDHGLKMLD